MTRLCWLFFVVLAIVPAMLFAGDIQVACGPGLRVYLDGKFVGTSNAKDDGLFLANVAQGAHTIRVEKDGFLPQTFNIEVQNLPIEVRVSTFIAEPAKPREKEIASGEEKKDVGSLLVTSAPQDCLVEVDGKPQYKSVPVLVIKDLAAGEHRISFSKSGYDRIDDVVRIPPGVQVAIRGDLKAGTVETIHEGTGSLRVISVPEYCTVHFLGKSREKTGGRLNISYVPAGVHRIVVSWHGRTLSSDILIVNGQRAVVSVSFLKRDQPFVVTYQPE
jgi:hypothetical protein